MQTDFWNQRYAEEAYAYGTAPSAWLRKQLPAGKGQSILFPAEGEGRNAVYAATIGWRCFAFDQSVEGRKKALRLADHFKVDIDYRIGSPELLDYPPASFDAIALIYAHFAAADLLPFHRRILSWLKPGGRLYFEAFGKQHPVYKQANPAVGGPDNPDMLFSETELRSLLGGYRMIDIREGEQKLSEGVYHRGTGWVLQAVAEKVMQ
jgi:SAM-dependent methyltransferase